MAYTESGMPYTVHTIYAGIPVLYTNIDSSPGAGTWSGVVAKVNHGSRHRDMGTSWAWVDFDGIVVPEACVHGIAGPQGLKRSKVDFDKLTVRTPGPDDTTKCAIWTAKVAAYDAQQLALIAANKVAAMELYSHFRAGQHVSWQQSSAVIYNGTIESVDLSNLCAVVISTLKGALMRYTLSLHLLTRMCGCGIDCAPGLMCGSSTYNALKKGTKDIWLC